MISEESNMVKGRAPVISIGNSFYLRLDKYIRENLSINAGTILAYKLWNIPVEKVICPKCKFEFEGEIGNDPHDCPSCGEEFLHINSLTNKETNK